MNPSSRSELALVSPAIGGGVAAFLAAAAVVAVPSSALLFAIAAVLVGALIFGLSTTARRWFPPRTLVVGIVATSGGAMVLLAGGFQLGDRSPERINGVDMQRVHVRATVLEPGSVQPESADPDEVLDAGQARPGYLSTRIDAEILPEHSVVPGTDGHPSDDGTGAANGPSGEQSGGASARNSGTPTMEPPVTRATLRAIIRCPEVQTVAWGERLHGSGRLRADHGRPGTAGRIIIDNCAERTAPDGFLGATARVRAAWSATAASFPGDGGALMTGLSIGDDSRVPAELDQAMVQSGLSHLTAVSGANCVIVVGLVVLMMKRFRVRRLVRIGCGGVALVGFVTLVTPEPSVVRAGVMALIVLVSQGLGRTAAPLAVLSSACALCLCANPWLVLEYGFLLSVASTLALVTLAGPLSSVFERVLPHWAAIALAVPIAAHLACQPITVILDPVLSVGAIPANILAAPAAPAATVVGLIGCVLAPALPGLATLVAAIAWVPSAWIGLCARSVSSAEFLRIPLPAGIAAVVFTVTLVFVVAVIVRASLRGARGVSRAGIVGLIMLFVIAIAGAGAKPIIERAPVPPDWTVFGCDVGQGDAVLIRSGNRVALIDSGPDAEAMENCLALASVERVDLFIVSHFDSDHVGGSAALTGKVDRVIVPHDSRPQAQRVARSFEADGGHLERAHAGLSGVLGRLRWSILWPENHRETRWDANDRSLVVMVRTPTGSALFLGDTSRESQSALMRSTFWSDTPIDLVKVAHHGSADQYPPLYRGIRARSAYIGVGADNDYGHPRSETLTALGNVPVGRTDRCGWVAWTSVSRAPVTQRACSDGDAG